MNFREIAIYGTGLIGGSIAMAAKKHIPGIKITAIDTNRTALGIASKKKLADKIINTSDDLKFLSSCSIVIVATPVKLIAEIVLKIIPFVSPDTVITDTGSVKSEIIKTITKKYGKKTPFIGSHPLAGTEKTGIKFAHSNILEGKKVIITPTRESPQNNLKKIREFWTKIGMKPLMVSPQEHDKALAYTSHFPHLLAYMLVNTIDEKKIEENSFWQFIGPGFRDFTRIAKSDPKLWTEITMLNKKEILKASKDFKKQLRKIETLIKSSKEGNIEKLLDKSQKTRKKLKQ